MLLEKQKRYFRPVCKTAVFLKKLLLSFQTSCTSKTCVTNRFIRTWGHIGRIKKLHPSLDHLVPPIINTVSPTNKEKYAIFQIDCNSTNTAHDNRLGRTLGRGEKGEILDRFEIFNSVQVRAPAIELDQTKTVQKNRDAGKFPSGRQGSSVSLYIFCSDGALYFVKIVFVCIYFKYKFALDNFCFSLSTPFYIYVPISTIMYICVLNEPWESLENKHTCL